MPHTAAALVAYGTTLLRVPLAVVAALLIVSDHRLMAAGCVLAFIVVDIYDGMIARLVGQETACRRILDVVIDRLGIHLVAATACWHFKSGFVVWAILIARDVWQARSSWVLLRSQRRVVVGAGWHRAYGLAVACWGLWLVLNSSTPLPVGVLTALLAIIVCVDYRARAGKVPATHADRPEERR